MPVVATIMEVLQQVFEGWQVDEQAIQFLLHGHAFVAHLVLQAHQVVMGVSSSRILNSKQLFLALISSSGIRSNKHSNKLISGVVTLDDLFKDG